MGIATQLQKARRTGLTFAPEAGTWRMRQVINKLIREEDLYSAVDAAYAKGWRRMKLYFLTGLPTETDEDTLGIAELARNCVEIGRKHTKSPSVTVSLGGFVPKPFTPFQWFGQNTVEELRRKINLLRDDTRRNHGVKVKWHDPKATLAEGIMSRGDRRLGPVIEEVWRRGGTFQEWSEKFDLTLWHEAMANHGLDPDWYVHRHRTEDEVLPWDHLSAGLHKDFLWQDWRDALAEVGLPDCRWTPCYDCGACTGYSHRAHRGLGHPARRRLAGHRPGPQPQLGPGRPAHPQAGAVRRGGPPVRVRLRYSKLGKVRFTSHRDIARCLERAVRRAELPVASTEGFSPRPKMHFGLALSTGHESLGEYLDVDLTDPEGAEVDLEALPERLTPLLPPGIDVEAVVVIDRSETSLQEAVTSCTWVIEVPGPSPEVLTAAVDSMLAATELPVNRERKGKKVADDLRPCILGLSVVGATPPTLPSRGRARRPTGHPTPLGAARRTAGRVRPAPHRGPGPQDQPMDHLRRRDARAPLAERAVPGARHGRRVMRRERPMTDPTVNDRPGTPGESPRPTPDTSASTPRRPLRRRLPPLRHRLPPRLSARRRPGRPGTRWRALR